MSEPDVKNMTIKELREFNMNPRLFHQVKHTDAFKILIDRLEQTECVVHRFLLHAEGKNTDGHTRVEGDDHACTQNYQLCLKRAREVVQERW